MGPLFGLHLTVGPVRKISSVTCSQLVHRRPSAGAFSSVVQFERACRRCVRKKSPEVHVFSGRLGETLCRRHLKSERLRSWATICRANAALPLSPPTFAAAWRKSIPTRNV